MKLVLQDGAPRSHGEATVNIAKNGNTLEISASPETSENPPVILEFYRGKLTLRIYGKNGSPSVEQDIPVAVGVPPAKQADPKPASEPAAPSNPAATSAPATSSVVDDEVAAFDAA